MLLWLVIGGLFFGAVQDFGALYASVKNEGKSMGMIIEKYIGKTGRKLFMLFCWLFTLLVIAAFTDMVAGTFVAKGVADMAADTAYANAAAASISMLFIVVAVIFGLIQKKVGTMKEWVRAVVAIALLVVMFAVGMYLPIYATKSAWIYIVMAYLFFSIRYADVAPDAAKRLYDDIYAAWYDRRCGIRCTCCTSEHAAECI